MAGGGGGSQANQGGAGGGTEAYPPAGNGAGWYWGYQATQTSGYAFGYGENAYSRGSCGGSEAGGGGGGWMGGYTISHIANNCGSGGGGSGYLSPLLTESVTLHGFQNIPTFNGTDTMYGNQHRGGHAKVVMRDYSRNNYLDVLNISSFKKVIIS